MAPYLLSLILMTISGEPTHIVEMKKDYAECHAALGAVASALSNINRVLEGKCSLLQKQEPDKPKNPEQPS